jgi:hypothetical protein
VPSFFPGDPQKWQSLVSTLLKNYPNAARRTVYDILNEPDNFGVAWEAQVAPPSPNCKNYLS